MILLLAFVLLGITYLFWHHQQKAKALEEELIALKDIQEVLITKAALQSREEERLRIARDWHDGMGNVISTARLLTDNIQTEDRSRLKEVQSLLENAHATAKSIARNLRTFKLQTYQDLLHYLETQKTRLAHGNVDLQYTVNAEQAFNDLQQEDKWHLYNILQELITNSIQHATATTIQIHLHEEKGRLLLEVADDGQGFNNQQQTFPKAVQERVTLLKGRLQLESAESKGTKVLIQF